MLMAAIIFVAACLCVCGVILYGVHGLAAQVFCKSDWQGKGLRRSVALTFDDGPSPATPEIASYLEGEGVRATFFQCGANVLRHPGMARRLHQRGHELGNHTFSHVRLCPRIGWSLNLLSPRRVYREFAAAQRAITSDAGVSPTLFRAPYGMKWFGLRQVERRLRLHGVMWTVIGRDWELSADAVVAHVMSHIRPGAIICLHDGRDTRIDPDLSVVLETVRRLVPQLKSMGYSFETVSGILDRH